MTLPLFRLQPLFLLLGKKQFEKNLQCGSWMCSGYFKRKDESESKCHRFGYNLVTKSIEDNVITVTGSFSIVFWAVCFKPDQNCCCCQWHRNCPVTFITMMTVCDSTTVNAHKFDIYAVHVFGFWLHLRPAERNQYFLKYWRTTA